MIVNEEAFKIIVKHKNFKVLLLIDAINNPFNIGNVFKWEFSMKIIIQSHVTSTNTSQYW